MRCYRVTFYNRNIDHGVDSTTIWVEASNDHHAVAEATMLAMGGTGNEDAEQIGAWLRAGKVTSVYAVTETS